MVQTVFYHGTSPARLEKIQDIGFLRAPVYVTSSLKAARWFAKSAVQFHPNAVERKKRAVLSLDLSGYLIEPDPDPEATYPGTVFTGACFIVSKDVPVSRILDVHLDGPPRRSGKATVHRRKTRVHKFDAKDLQSIKKG